MFKARNVFPIGFLASRSLKQDHTLTGFDKLKNPKRKAQYFSLFLFSRSTGLCHNEMQIFASRESTKRNTSNSFSQNQICFSTRSKYVPPREANLCFSWMQKKVTQKSLFFPFSVLLTEASMCLLEKNRVKKEITIFSIFEDASYVWKIVPLQESNMYFSWKQKIITISFFPFREALGKANLCLHEKEICVSHGGIYNVEKPEFLIFGSPWEANLCPHENQTCVSRGSTTFFVGKIFSSKTRGKQA